MWSRLFPLIVSFALFVPALAAQDRGRRDEVEEGLASRYRLTRLGASALGFHGNDNSIRHAGGTVFLRKNGLFGAFDRKQMPLNSIRNDQAELLSGDREKAVPLTQGQRFYVTAASVGSDVIVLGLLSSSPTLDQAGTKSSDVWASLSFFFSKDVLAQGQLSKIYAVLDQWLAAEGSAVAAPYAAPAVVTPAPEPVAMPAPAPLPAVDLRPGMLREDVIKILGPPRREVSFGEKRWLEYPQMLVIIENGKLASVERNAVATAGVKISSDPSGAEVYVDGNLVGSTPSSLQLVPGIHAIIVKSSGYQEWRRDLNVLPGSDLTLNAALTK